MNRFILIMTGMFSVSGLLLVDLAIKGAALLMLAAIACFLLRRDSAATRHLMWLLAMVALLLVPALSMMLPEWRVLPEWARVGRETSAVASKPADVAAPGRVDVASPTNVEAGDVEGPSKVARPVATGDVGLPGGLVEAKAAPAAAVSGWKWIDVLPVVWAIGFIVLILRLVAARVMLWRFERGSVAVGNSERSSMTDLSMVAALEAACSQLGIARPVTLLIHPEKAIPVVWGIFRCRLLLPAAARQWDGAQLRSVLLHELAHVKRRDALAQLLVQVACALHWFNPFAWVAAWRLGVERERACDDLVLASGVRPSAYAGHLLDVVTALSSARWGASGGLAMARKSSLEGRLLAVLSKNQSRRGVSVALAAIAFIIGVGIVVPVAMLRAADQKPQDKPPAAAAAALQPRSEKAQWLYDKWQNSARTDGKIPGALIGQLGRDVDLFCQQYPQDPNSAKFTAMRARIDPSHDWTPAEAVALLDEITDISMAPISWSDLRKEMGKMWDTKEGQPLPKELESADWGPPEKNGLRAAWLLEPRADEYALGSVLKVRVLFHNTGKEPVIFTTELWHQWDQHKAIDAKGARIPSDHGFNTGLTRAATYLLAPGGYCEVKGRDIFIGEHGIAAKVGDEVRLSHVVDATQGSRFQGTEAKEAAEAWKKHVAARLEREAPLPSTAADREQLIRRVTRDLFGVPATAEEIAAFVGDTAPDALAKLTARLEAKPRIEHWAGRLPTGETKFRVLAAADPDAAKKPAEKPAAAPADAKPNDSAKLDPAIEKKVQWGATVNGLRAALVIRNSPGELNAAGTPDLYLLVQNVSDAPIRFNDTVAAPNVRYLTFHRDEVPQGRIRIDQPTQADATLQPREATYVLMCPRGITRGQSLAAGMLKEPHMILVGEINIEKAPEGTWTGKLVSGSTGGAAANIDPPAAPKAPDAPRKE